MRKQSMKNRNYRLDIKSAPKYKYSFNQKTYDLNIGTSLNLDSKLGITRVDQTSLLPEKIKSSGSFNLQDTKYVKKQSYSTAKIINKKSTGTDQFKLPSIKKKFSLFDNPQQKQKISKKMPQKQVYYQTRIKNSIFTSQTNYLINLARQHFMQSIQALRIGKTIKLPLPNKQIKLSKKNPKFKTVYLDLDQTLIHCDQNSNNYTVKLNFPLQGGSIVAAGIRVRPHCQQFIQKLSSFAEIIIFTASSSSYADVVLDYLDPHKKYFAHRLYRHHCTLQKGFYTKDLRVVNRRLEDSVLLDNSAFCYMMQPYNGIPILPYYHYGKDKQLLLALQYIRQILQSQDVRQAIKKTFFWQKYLQNDGDSRKIFQDNFGKQQK